MEKLYQKLSDYSKTDYYGFHMPGHKRNADFTGAELPYGIDITEIEGFDDLHHAEGILKEAQEHAAKVFGAEETHYLINGSTVGILCAILGNTEKKDKILVARHCHKSVHHAIYLGELNPRYLYPSYDLEGHVNGEIASEAVEAALRRESDIRAVVIVSPTYEGVVSDIAKIAEVVHRHGKILIVDEAHGAHFGFHKAFPPRAISLGADVVIQSLHKTLPSLTQTALLHITGPRADREKVKMYLDMLQSSSPSYVLMAGMDACVNLMDQKAEVLFEEYVQNLTHLRAELRQMKHLKLWERAHTDISKLVISVGDSKMSSKELYMKLLNDYHLQMEMVGGTYVLAMTTVADTKEGLRRLGKALMELDHEMEETGNWSSDKQELVTGELPKLEQVLTPYQVMCRKEKGLLKEMPMEESAGRISTEFAYLYPPGSPVIVPGERISEEAIRLLQDYEQKKFRVEGCKKKGFIRVLTNE